MKINYVKIHARSQEIEPTTFTMEDMLLQIMTNKDECSPVGIPTDSSYSLVTIVHSGIRDYSYIFY